jgi:hypothetical protein
VPCHRITASSKKRLSAALAAIASSTCLSGSGERGLLASHLVGGPWKRYAIRPNNQLSASARECRRNGEP